jgi:hypothetical protein
VGACACVEQHTDEEQVNQSATALGCVDFLGPCGEKLRDAIAATDAEVLIPPMTRDVCEGSIVVALREKNTIGQLLAL